MLATRRPENHIGWTFLIAGLAVGLTASCDQYSNHTLSMDAGAPAGLVAMWLSRWLWPIPVGALPFLFLLFPSTGVVGEDPRDEGASVAIRLRSTLGSHDTRRSHARRRPSADVQGTLEVRLSR